MNKGKPTIKARSTPQNTPFSLIVTSIGLIPGSICDQQYWQRSFAIKESDLKRAFIFGSILFGFVPIGLSILGFLAANPHLAIKLPEGTDAALIGVATITLSLSFYRAGEWYSSF